MEKARPIAGRDIGSPLSATSLKKQSSDPEN